MGKQAKGGKKTAHKPPSGKQEDEGGGGGGGGGGERRSGKGSAKQVRPAAVAPLLVDLLCGGCWGRLINCVCSFLQLSLVGGWLSSGLCSTGSLAHASSCPVFTCSAAVPHVITTGREMILSESWRRLGCESRRWIVMVGGRVGGRWHRWGFALRPSAGWRVGGRRQSAWTEHWEDVTSQWCFWEDVTSQWCFWEDVTSQRCFWGDVASQWCFGLLCYGSLPTWPASCFAARLQATASSAASATS